MGDENHGMWGHLQLLVRASSTEMVDYILQALWRTRRTGLDAADRQIFRDILQLSNDSDLDPVIMQLKDAVLIMQFLHHGCFRRMGGAYFRHDSFIPIHLRVVRIVLLQLLVCLRVLIRRCAYGNLDGDEISKLFSAEVLPELQRLLTLRFQKFLKEWQEDISKEQASSPRLRSTASQMKLLLSLSVFLLTNVWFSYYILRALPMEYRPSTAAYRRKPKDKKDVKFLLAKDTMEMMLQTM